MSNMPLTDGINALIRYANETTGASDTTLSDAVESLVAGYGGGGGWSADGLATGAEPSGDITIEASSFREYAFHNCTQLTGVTLPNATNLPKETFSGCSRLASFFAPNLTAFSGAGCLANSALSVIDFPKLTSLQAATFYGSHQLTTLILRANSICGVGNANALQDTPFRGYNSLTGTLYVPSALVESYKTANNWKTLYEAGTMTILPIEGSIYETQYADGTPITT